MDLGEAASESQVLQPEVEPNAAAASATPIGGANAVLLGDIYPGADVDYYSFTASAGDRVYAAVMPAFSAAGDTDADLYVLDADGATELEYDDGNGSFGTFSPAIGGTLIPAAGTYYIRVEHFTPGTQIRPYHLHFQLRGGTPDLELLDLTNGTVPEPLVSGWVSGSTLTAADVDLYSIALQAGDTLYASLDLDPERDGEWDGTLALGPVGDPAGFLGVNDNGADSPDAEAIFLTVKTAGIYQIRVGASVTFGTYHLSVSVHPAGGAACTTYTSTDVPKAIADVTLSTSTITIPDATIIGDLDVTLTADHTFIPDVDFHLLAPAGNVVGLATDVGISSVDIMDVTIDDEAAFPVNFTTNLNNLIVQPEITYRLHWFDGQAANGTWTLQMYDDANGDTGTLTAWSITICPAPVVTPSCPIGSTAEVIFTSDFEADDGGFTHSGTADEWARGLPTAAPFTTCNSGTNCWKTDLTGTYNASSSQDLVSSPILLSGNFVAPLRVQWSQKYQMDNATNDHAFVDVRLVNDTNPTRLFEFKDGLMTDSVGFTPTLVQESAGWGRHSGDLDGYAGQQVELVFHLDSNASTQAGGLAIDDVVVTGCRLPSMCGNGTQEPGEACDDSNTVGDDGCSADCLSDETCGNNVVDGTLAVDPEACDDGNNIDGDGCSADCLSDESCGNGIEDTAAGEVCDDSNTDPGDGCSANCLSDETCGNDVTDVTEGEQCDDGGTTGDDGCSADCLSDETCGNDVLDDTITPDPEVCDDGNTSGGDGCSGDCLSTEGCGNGIIDTAAGEVCDDSNIDPGDGCSANCRSDETCGNGVTDITEGEVCDDGNTIGLDGCSANCLSNETCGNGVEDPGEQCDDGNLVGGDGCTAECDDEICGNGIQDPGEECDDGNTTSGDGCNATCTVDEGCGNGVVDQDEECDDSNTADGDGCSADCDSDESCGNGIEELEEQCDDGNTTDGDGCESDCTYPEAGPRCGDGTVDDGEECDDGNRMNGDSCAADCTVEPDGERGCACNGGEGGASNLLVLGMVGLALFGTRRSTRRRKRLAHDERATRG